MYLISEQYKKTKTGGKGLCQVHYIANLKTRPADVTEAVANEYGFTYKNWNIVVHYWSGTWFMRISEEIKKDKKKAVIFAISAFKN